MSFDDLQHQWQAHDHGAKLALNCELLLQEVRHNHRAMQASLFWRDLVEVLAAILVALGFGSHAWRKHEWTLAVSALGALFVALFLVVDRWTQHRRRPASDDSMRSCVQASLVQVRHQIWLLRNILWWYLLPLFLGVFLFLGSLAWNERNAGWLPLFSLAMIALVFLLTVWGVYWLNQRAIKKTLEPRRVELELLLASLNQNSA